MNLMEYNGYHAKIEYDADDCIFVGSVLGLNDMLSFHGKSVNELQTAFKNCVDNYIAWCKEAGKEPEKEFKGAFNVRISPAAHRAVAIKAAGEGMSINQFVAEAINEKLLRA